jgi:hypothetical protein
MCLVVSAGRLHRSGRHDLGTRLFQLLRAVSDHRESVLIWIPKMLRMSESVRDNRFAGTGCLAPILLIYESVLSAR